MILVHRRAKTTVKKTVLLSHYVKVRLTPVLIISSFSFQLEMLTSLLCLSRLSCLSLILFTSFVENRTF